MFEFHVVIPFDLPTGIARVRMKDIKGLGINNRQYRTLLLSQPTDGVGILATTELYKRKKKLTDANS